MMSSLEDNDFQTENTLDNHKTDRTESPSEYQSFSSQGTSSNKRIKCDTFNDLNPNFCKRLKLKSSSEMYSVKDDLTSSCQRLLNFSNINDKKSSEIICSLSNFQNDISNGNISDTVDNTSLDVNTNLPLNSIRYIDSSTSDSLSTSNSVTNHKENCDNNLLNICLSNTRENSATPNFIKISSKNDANNLVKLKKVSVDLNKCNSIVPKLNYNEKNETEGQKLDLNKQNEVEYNINLNDNVENQVEEKVNSNELKSEMQKVKLITKNTENRRKNSWRNSESDKEELEDDDDNYLDSSEAEDDPQSIEELESVLPNDAEESCGEDDESVISCITVGSTCSLKSAASETMSSIYMNENGIAANEDGSLLYSSVSSKTPLNALNFSLFFHVPPTLNFCKFDEKTKPLPPPLNKMLKWRFTVITPVVVRKTIINSGFKILKKSIVWCGSWGKHMKSPLFKMVKEYQKVNHFPGTFQIGRKDKLWKNFAVLQSKYGKEEFGFVPKTFILPGDLNALKTAFNKDGVKKKWILKPPASARGTGIEVTDKWSQIPMDTALIVQRYIARPYLINDTKFDIRLYVLVTSFHPLRIFLYEDGLVRFASVPYEKSSKSLSDRFIHLTNYSVNKTSSSYTQNEDAGHCIGHKWTLKTLWGYLKAHEVDTGALWNKIADIVIKTIISGENEIAARTKKYTKTNYNCFELFGFDVMLDEKLRPWLLEVNISPSLHSPSSLDNSVKGSLASDLLNLVGYHIPDKLSQEKQADLVKELKLSDKLSTLCLDRRIYTRLLTPDEQAKQIQINTLPRSQYLNYILEDLRPCDIRQLVIAEDQLKRAGKFACIFPTSQTYNYFGFMSKGRYYNRLMDAWETRHSECRENGIEILKEFCEKKIHLIVPARFKLPKTAASVPPSHDKKSLTKLLQPFSAAKTDLELQDRPTLEPAFKSQDSDLKAYESNSSSNLLESPEKVGDFEKPAEVKALVEKAETKLTFQSAEVKPLAQEAEIKLDLQSAEEKLGLQSAEVNPLAQTAQDKLSLQSVEEKPLAQANEVLILQPTEVKPLSQTAENKLILQAAIDKGLQSA